MVMFILYINFPKSEIYCFYSDFLLSNTEDAAHTSPPSKCNISKISRHPSASDSAPWVHLRWCYGRKGTEMR